MEFVSFEKDNESHDKIFLKLLRDYFTELFKNDPEENLPDSAIPEILGDIKNAMSYELFWVYFCSIDNEFIGFVNAQIDTIENKSWCKKQGWGFIREFYIDPSYRKKGYAQKMCMFIEGIIKTNKARNIYLTTEENTFWEKMGYKDSGEVDDENKQNILIKEL